MIIHCLCAADETVRLRTNPYVISLDVTFEARAAPCTCVICVRETVHVVVHVFNYHVADLRGYCERGHDKYRPRYCVRYEVKTLGAAKAGYNDGAEGIVARNMRRNNNNNNDDGIRTNR